MKKVLLIIASLLSFTALYAQVFLFTGDGIIRGTVNDSVTSNPVAFASIAIYVMPKDTLIAGTLTDEKGTFSKEDLPNGNYTIKITCIGYKPITINNLKVEQKQLKIRLDNIKLSPLAIELKEATITGQRTSYEQTFNKKIFLMDEKRTAGAQNVLDQLKTLPSVTVDPDGNVKYRGQTPNILVDDQPYTLLYPKLEMIPAENVDKIEFIEPSARYESSVGTINIKLKRPKENGISGAIYTSAGAFDFNTLTQNNNGLNINYKYKKVILFGNANYYFYKGFSNNNESVRLDYNNNVYESISGMEYSYTSRNYSESVGMIYNFTKKKKFTFTWTPSSHLSDNTSNLNYHETVDGLNRELYSSLGTSESNNTGNSFAFNFSKKFENEEKELSLKANYSIQNSGWNANSRKIYSYYSYLPSDSIPEIRNSNITGSNRFSLESYFAVPIDTTGRWEIGSKSEFRNGTDNSKYYLNNVYVPEFSDDHARFNMSHAIYGNIGKKRKKFKFDGGLRFVLKTFNVDLMVHPNGSDSMIYIKKLYPMVVPNATIGYEIKPFHELKLTYILDQQLPDEYELSPYIDKSDPREWYSGNSNLKPYLYHRFSFGYLYAPKTYSISVDAFTYFSNNYVEWVTIPLNDFTTYSKPENIGKSSGTGITISGSAMPKQWFNCNFSTDIFKANINARNLNNTVPSSSLSNTGLKTSNWSVTGNSYMTFYIKKKNTISFYLNYMGKSISLGGYSKASLYNGIVLSRRFLKNKLNISVSVNNLIDKWSKWSTSTDYFGRQEISDYYGTWNKRSFRISVRYSFNKGDRGLLNTQADDSGSDPSATGGKK